MPQQLTRKFLLIDTVRKQRETSGENGEQKEKMVLRGIEARLLALGDAAKRLAVVFGLPERKDTWPHSWLILGVVPTVLFSSGVIHALMEARRNGMAGPHGTLVMLLGGVIVIGYTASRYMLVAYPLAALMAAAWVVSNSGVWRGFAVALLAATMVFNGPTLFDHVHGRPPERVDRLLKTLSQMDCTRGYSAGPMYHVAFRSDEAVLLTPLYNNRYPAYDEVVSAAATPCYVFREDQQERQQHRRFLNLLRDNGIAYASGEAGAYRFLYDFKPRTALTQALIDEARGK